MREGVRKCVGLWGRHKKRWREVGDVGKCGRKCVGAPHPNTLLYTSLIPLPTSLPLTPTHLPHTLSHTSPLPTHLSLLIPTPQHTSLHLTPHTSSHSSPHLPLHPNTLPHSLRALSHTSPHIFPHSLGYVAKLPRDDVALINLTGLWKSPIKFFTTTGNLKSCFGVGNVNFRCMKVWRSYHVAKLLWRSYHVAKLLATIINATE